MGIWDSLLQSLHGLPTTLGLTGPTNMQMTPYGQMGSAGQQDIMSALASNPSLVGLNPSMIQGVSGQAPAYGQGQQQQQQGNLGGLGQLYLNYLTARRLADLSKYQYAGLHTSPMTQMQPLPLGQPTPLQLPRLG